MGVFEHLPYTNFHDLNLDWILKTFKQAVGEINSLDNWRQEHEAEYEQLAHIVDVLVNNLSEPIEPWNSAIAYHIYSMVEYLGDYYIAIHDVPVGAMITDTNYWVIANTVLAQLNAISLITSQVQADTQDLQLHTQWYTTPQEYGAVADGVTDDTAAIQAALDSGYRYVFMYGDYATTQPLTITDKDILYVFQRGRIIYSGNDAALKFDQINNSIDLYLDNINAVNGNGIEFYAGTYDPNGIRHRNQYINLYFSRITAGDKCIYFHQDSIGTEDPNDVGWNNEIRIFNGRFSAGQYGAYSDPKGFNKCNGIRFYNIGVEGVTTGFHMGDGCQDWEFFGIRYSETFTKLIETVGTVSKFTFYGSKNIQDNWLDLSADTNGILYAPFVSGNETKAPAKIIVNGQIKIYGQIGLNSRMDSWSYDSANPVNLQTRGLLTTSGHGHYLAIFSTNTSGDTHAIYFISVQNGIVNAVIDINSSTTAQTPVVDSSGNVTKVSSTSTSAIRLLLIQLDN